MPYLDRSFWLAVGLTLYAGGGAVLTAGSRRWGIAAMALCSLCLWLTWRKTHDHEAMSRHPAAVRALKAVVAGGSIWLCARLGSPGSAVTELSATVGAGSASVAAAYALARIPVARGLLSSPRSARSLDAAALIAVLWSVAFVVGAGRFLDPGSFRLDPLTLDYAGTAASIGSLLLLAAAAWRIRYGRGLELGVGDRAAGALTWAVACLAVAIPAAAAKVAPPDRLLPAATILAALGVTWTGLTSDARRVSRALRSVLVLLFLGTPTALLTGALARQSPRDAGALTLLGCVVAMAVGIITRAASDPLGPEQSRWLNALARASEGALVPEPTQAIVATLTALKGTSTSPRARPELWLLDPPRIQSVDVAGYLHEEEGTAPGELSDLAQEEAEHTIRVEVLRAVQIRRPEVRGLLDWFELRGAFSATLVRNEEGPIGFLLLPRGGRDAHMTLEEAHAANTLAQRLSALSNVTASLARARRREQEAVQEAATWKDRHDRKRDVLEGQQSRHRVQASAIARGITVAAYSQAAREALQTLEQLATRSSPAIAMVTPCGSSPEAWAAVFHLASAGDALGPFVAVDGSIERQQPDGYWQDRSCSPLHIAAGGTVLLSASAQLEPAQQLELTETLTALQSSEPGTVRPARLIVSVANREPRCWGLSPALTGLLKSAVVELPSLEDRPEDFRALVLAELARCSPAPASAPLGVERRALQLLLDYPWPGNERQLSDVLSRAALRCSGPLLTTADLQRIDFPPGGAPSLPPPLTPTLNPPPSSSLPPPEQAPAARRRRPSRAPRRPRRPS